MNIFLDTNILLSFYHYTKDDLEELKKLGVLLKRDRATLFLPDEVKQEFNRNREVKIADALRRLEGQKLALQFPQMCKEYPEFRDARQAQQDYERAHARLLEQIKADAHAKALRADETIKELLEGATPIRTSDEIISRARLRMDRGNPPGKPGSLGDRICWEALLAEGPDRKDLYFVSADGDYVSALEKASFSRFLLDEWTEEKSS